MKASYSQRQGLHVALGMQDLTNLTAGRAATGVIGLSGQTAKALQRGVDGVQIYFFRDLNSPIQGALYIEIGLEAIKRIIRNQYYVQQGKGTIDARIVLDRNL